MTAPIDLHWVQRPGTRLRSIVQPATVRQALDELQADPQLRPVAGGTDLVLELARSGAGGEVTLLDLTAIDGFSTIDLSSDPIQLGAGVRHADILANTQAREQLLALAQACLEVGSPQLRNRATLVGNLVTASPANDTISALMALDAVVVIASLEGGDVIERNVSLDEFYTGFRSTVLAEGELVVRLEIPAPAPGSRSIWVKAGLRKAQAISVVHAGFQLGFADDGTVSDARIALGSVGPTVALNTAAAAELIGSPLTTATIEAAAAAAADSVTPIDDGRATAEYRSSIVRTVVQRALTALAAGTEADQWPDRVPVLSERRSSAASVNSSTVRRVEEVTATVNGVPYTAAPTGSGTLLDWLRDVVATGTKEGCAEGECGACTVDLDGAAVMSCIVPAAQADGATIVTIEGLGSESAAHPMQQAFVDKFAVQCGYCIPGFIMAADHLAREIDTAPTREEIELALSGNLCRCTGYYNIIDAVQIAVAVELEGQQ